MTIRKILLLQFICLSSVFYCHAGTGIGSFTVGADAGPGFSGLYGSSAYFSPSRLAEFSPSAGINFRYNFPKILSIASGIYYCKFGYNYHPSPLLAPNYNAFILIGGWNTINIPLLARVRYGKKVVFFAEGGAFLSVILKGLVSYGDAYVFPWYPQRKINAGIIAGTGIEVPLPHRFALSFEASSNVGLENIVGNGIVFNGLYYPSSNGYIKTYSCTLLCGFSYTLPVTTGKLKTADGGYNTIFRN